MGLGITADMVKVKAAYRRLLGLEADILGQVRDLKAVLRSAGGCEAGSGGRKRKWVGECGC